MRASSVLYSSLSLFAIGAILTAPVMAQERPRITIYGAQVPMEAPKLGSSLTILTGQELEDRGISTLAEALRIVPGVAVSSSGSRGALTQVRIRGAEANHLKVVVDGIEMNEISGEGFNFADIPVENIEQLEVLRGPQSGLYGANAHAGVIAVTTKSGRGSRKPEGEVGASFGSLGYRDGHASVRGAAEQGYGSAHVQASRDSGFNIARTGAERDESRNVSLNLRAGVDVTPDVNFESAFKILDRFAASDVQNSITGLTVDSDANSRTRSIAGRVAMTHRFWEGKLTQRMSASAMNERFTYTGASVTPSNSDGTRIDLDYKLTGQETTNWWGGEKHTLTIGTDFRDETYASSSLPAEKTRQRWGVFTDYVLDLPTHTTLGLSARQDANNPFKSATTYRLTASQRLPEWAVRLHGSYGTGVTAPSFVELYANFGPSFVGNPNLKPEISRGWDIGVEKAWWNKKITTDVTYFQSRFTDQIAYVFPTMLNIPGTATRQGIETTLTATPLPWLDVSASYTWLLAERSNGIQEIRRPRHAVALALTARWMDNRLKTTVGLTTTGDIRDTWFKFPSQSVTLKPFTNLTSKISYDLKPGTTVFLQGNNLLNQKREEVFSYRRPGLEVKTGLVIKFGQ